MALPDARAVSAVSAVNGIIPGSRQSGSSAVSGISASEVTIPENDDHADTDGSHTAGSFILLPSDGREATDGKE
jgi:hypothetical protein